MKSPLPDSTSVDAISPGVAVKGEEEPSSVDEKTTQAEDVKKGS